MPLTLEIVTPEQRALSISCDEVRLPSVEGSFGVRPGHTPLVAALAAGELIYVTAGTERRYAVGEGFAEVSNDQVRVLVEEATRAEELDAAGAQKDHAEKEKAFLALNQDDPSYEQQRALVQRAAARASVAARR